MSILLSFDAAELKYDFDDEDEEGEDELHKHLPIKVEISVNSKKSVVVSGEVSCDILVLTLFRVGFAKPFFRGFCISFRLKIRTLSVTVTEMCVGSTPIKLIQR
jgi:hypothetical protein